jgi:hypothetical protein
MKPKYFALINHLVENGVESGWEWAHKHDAHPPSHSIKEAIADHIMKEIAEYFDFDETII